MKVSLVDDLVRQAQQAAQNGGAPAEKEKKPSPSEGVDQLIRAEPGIERGKLLERLATEAESESDEPSRVVSAAVSRGKRRKLYYESKDGHLWLYNHPEAIRRREGLTQTELVQDDEGMT